MSLLIYEANEIPKQTATASAGTTNRGAWLRRMVTAAQVLEVNSRIRNAEVVASLANELKACSAPVRAQDPIQVWEAHPVVSGYLGKLRDREICVAIDLSQS